MDADLLEKSELFRLKSQLLELRRLQKANGIKFYQPHVKQAKFHAANKKRRYVRTGNRWGKSTAGAAEDIAWCMGERIWLDESDPARYVGIPKHSVKGVLICADWDKANEIFTSQADGQARGKIFKLLPTSAFAGIEKTQGGDICAIHIKSKWGGVSTLYIDTVKSFKNNPMGHESSDWDFIHVDEPLPQAMWEAHARGLIDRGGSAWFMCTPLEEMWINDVFIPSRRAKEDFPDGIEFEDTWVMTGSTSDNPHLSSENILQMSKDTRASELEARLHGRPRLFAGIIHQNFSSDIHVYDYVPAGWKDATTPPKDWTIRLAIDPHPKIPHACLFTATGPTGHTFIFCDLFLKLRISEFAERINEVLARIGDGVPVEPYLALCDPLAWTPNPINEVRYVDEFNNYGLYPLPGSKDVSYGIQRTEDMFEARDEYGLPMLLVHKSCNQFLYEVDRYVWDSQREKPKDKQSDHQLENLHRLAVARLDYVKPHQKQIKLQVRDLAHHSFSLPQRQLSSPGKLNTAYSFRYPSQRHV